ncbi:protein misato homolog 1 isoform X2 [Rhinatrema bivittatum]|uniref:protein misato homolog 1 isoform X2 n=1 Tax=Rhinatrema bivittatum TaxID=194408 RepID=UPI00112AA739|nr:protein misato homolog 1 isoform X2 [Rhinatrema bivittatum]
MAESGMEQDAALSYSAGAKLQEHEISSDVLFREGQTLSGQETYTPRLILMDLKGSLNSLRQEGCLYEDDKVDWTVAWQGSVATYKEEAPVKNPFLQDLNMLEGETVTEADGSPRGFPDGRGVFQRNVREGTPKACRKTYQLEGSVQVWSDYLRTHLHPKTVSVVQQYTHEGESDRLDAFGQGERLLNEPAYLQDLEDRLHFYAEECDYLQGFQVLCDIQDGFSGVGAKVTELLHDEFSGRGILTWGTTPIIPAERDPVKDMYRLLNTVLGIVHLSTHSSLFCPLSLNGSLGRRPQPPVSFPHVLYDPTLNYHSSALLATALESLSVPYRKRSFPLSMAQLADALNFSGRKVVTAWASVPFPMGHSHSLPDILCRSLEAVPWRPLSSCGEPSASPCFAQSVVLRGISRERQTSNLLPGISPHSRLHVYETGEEVLDCYLQMLYPGILSALHVLEGPCKVAASYPQFFSQSVNRDGFIMEEPVSFPRVVESIPVLASFQSSAVLRSTLQHLHQEVSQVDVRRWASFFNVGVELEDFHEALYELKNLSDCYKSSFELDETGSD